MSDGEQTQRAAFARLLLDYGDASFRCGEYRGDNADTYAEFSDAREAAYQAVLAAQTQRAPEGWKLVPIEPTEAMLKAGGHVNSEWLNDNAPIGEARYVAPMQGAWKAMLAASPQSETPS